MIGFTMSSICTPSRQLTYSEAEEMEAEETVDDDMMVLTD